MRQHYSLIVLASLLVATRSFAQEVVLEETEAPPDPPAADQDAPASEPEPEAKSAKRPPPRVVQMQDTRPQVRGGGMRAGGSTTVSGPELANQKAWDFTYHGYFRAPMRIGIGRRDEPTEGQSENTFHAPVVPDDQYLSWQHTKHSSRDWAEMFFSVGNEWARGTVAITGYNFGDAAWNEDGSQFGISQGWVTLTPDLGYENVRLIAKAGAFWAGYGQAGRYDAGEYDTYLFGRTHVLGETLRAELDIDRFTLYGEHGFGTKRPNPSEYNRARFTLLNHAHAGVLWARKLDVAFHWLDSFAQEELRFGQLREIDSAQPDGSLSVYGGELRWDIGMFGYLYGGYSRVNAEHAITVAPAIEVIHSSGGGEFTLGITDNYLDSRGCGLEGRPACSGGNGKVDTIAGQYEFSLHNLLNGLADEPAFWGLGEDLYLKLYGMMNWVTSDDTLQDGVKKVKYGADLSYSALPWLAVGVRADQVDPNSKIPEQAFSIVSPRIDFRSTWVTREQITLQYSRYFYEQRACTPPAHPADNIYQVGEERCVQPPSAPVLPDGFGATSQNQTPGNRGAPTTRPDLNVVRVEATMWW